MRFILLVSLLSLKLCTAQGQSFFQIYGPQQVSALCQPYTYSLESEDQLTSTIWLLISAPGGSPMALSGGLYDVEVFFYDPGVYTLIAQSIGINGTQLTDSITIFVSGQSAQLSVLGCSLLNVKTRCYQVCANTTSVIYDPNCGNFDITGADNVHLLDSCSVEVTWGAGGNATVSSINLCSVTLCFEILPEPVASFTTFPAGQKDTLVVCKNKEIVFTNTSVNGLSYAWSFGDGALSASFDAVHAYASEGIYTVTLSAQTICGCNDEKQMVIQVLPEPAPTLDCVNTVCPETRQRYTATTDGCSQYTWLISANGTVVNGGKPGDDFIEIIWHDGPDGYIELSVAGCNTNYCTASNIFRIPIVTPDGPITGDASVCTGEIVNYTAPYFPGTSYQWDIGPYGVIESGLNTHAITVHWSDVSVVTSSYISVSYENCFLACDGSDMLNVQITPEITLLADEQVCQDGVASANAVAGFISQLPANVSWHIEDENGQVVYTEPGLSSTFMHTFAYPPGVYAWVGVNNSSSYCSESVRQKIVITAQPLAPSGILGESIICPGQPYGFTIDAAGQFATQWTITDGSNTYHAQGQSCQHTFGNNPPYAVEAVHTDIQFSSCASTPVVMNLHTIDEYTISGPTDVCYNGIDAFSIPLASGLDYQWEVIPADHGEIKKSDLNQVEVFWTLSGPVTLRLNACGHTIDLPVTVHTLPSFQVLGPLAACANEQVMVSTDQPALEHIWKNEQGTLLSNLNQVQFYPGTYVVSLTDALGCVADETFTITTYPAPEVHISSTADTYFCTNVPGGVDLVANTDGGGYTFLWFQDGVSTGSTGPVYNVTDFADYHVEVTNSYGCKTQSPDVAFKNCCTPPCGGGGGGGPFPAGCTYQIYDFDIEKMESECHVHTFTPHDPLIIPGQTRWLIRSISEGYVADVDADVLSYTYSLPGYYFITAVSKLTGFPYSAINCGHAEDIIDTVRAVADFKHEGICVQSNIEFEDLTTFLPNESIASWAWNFDDPASGADNSSSLQHPVHIFSAGGNYNVRLNVTLTSGCQSAVTKMVHISEGPMLLPQFEPIFCEREANAMLLPGQVFDVDWDFGDPGSGNQNEAFAASVFHTYVGTGVYSVAVSAADIYTCRSETTFNVDIHPNTLSGLIAVDPAAVLCYGDTATLTAPAGGQSWLWSTSEVTDHIDVAESNQYNVVLADQYHCTYSPPSAFVDITPKPELIIQAREILGADSYGLWQNELHICKGTEFELSGFSSVSGVLYHWLHGPTSQVIQFTDESGTLLTPGTYSFSLFVIDAISGCVSDTAQITIEIYDLPQIPVIALAGGTGCSFDMNTLQVTNPEPGVMYHWSDGQVGQSITVQYAGSYYVTAFNAQGCASQSGLVTIKPSGAIDLIPGGCHIKCDPLTVCLPDIPDITSWIIYQNGSIYQTGTVWPDNYLISTDGSYTIEVTTSNGCKATSAPLDILLYPGVGSITVLTYLDVDHDGMITAADILLSGIPVEILSDDGQQSGMTYTTIDGSFVFEDYPASGYLAFFNPLLLSSQWKIVLDSVQTDILTCGDSVIVSLLLEENCIVTGPDLMIESCPGDVVMIEDSLWSDTGQFTLHLLSDLGCDSIVQVHILRPDSLQIGATVWADVDQNGILSPADTVVEGITIMIDALINQAPYIEVTDGQGQVSGEFPSRPYMIAIDSTLLPPGMYIIYGEDFIPDTVCGSVYFNFLLGPSCANEIFIQQEAICEGDSILIENQWITDSGVYSFLLSQPGAGCDTTLDVYVTLLPSPAMESALDWNCNTLGSIDLTVNGTAPFQFIWSPSVPGNAMVSGLSDGTYAVFISDAYGCTTSDTFTILSPPTLQFDLPPLYEITAGDSVAISLTGDILVDGLTFQWIPPEITSCPTCPTTWASPASSTSLSLLITSADSCVYGLETFIEVTFDSSLIDRIYVPNVFTPNGDGINDHWRIFSRLENTYVNSLTLFDRWGTLLFHKENFYLNAFDGWDGNFKGKPMQPNVFTYMADLTLGDGVNTKVKGNVTLVR